jgi:protein-tyrosine phosphatase
MIDFHSHVLPYVDDGAKNFDMTLDMLRISEAEGVKYICATSHFIPEEMEISKKYYDTKLDNVRQLAKLKDIKVQVLPALELYMSPELPRLYKEKKIWGINDTQYLLIEFPMQQIPMYAEEVLYELRLQGAVPVIAHPERNFAIIKNEKLLEDFINQGALAQVNAGSLRGIYGKDIKSFAEHLVTRNMVHLLGSDGHNDKERSTTMVKGREAINLLNPELHDWMGQAQYKVINGEEIVVPEVKSAKRGFDFTKLFR